MIAEPSADPAATPEIAIAAPQDPGVTAALADWICAQSFDGIPERARRIAGLALLDWYAVTFAGADEPACRLLRKTLVPGSGPEDADIIGTDRGTDMWTAALINGAAGHALDYDDVHNALPGHATAPVAPAVLALAEKTGASGRDLLGAFVVGFETTCRIGRFTSPGLFRRGYQGSSTAGCIGAAAACGHLLGLDARRMGAAIGLAATQAGGLQATFGSMAKCLNVGKAAQSGLVAAMLADTDFDCAGNVLEAPRGYGAVFADGGDAEAALADPPGGWHLYRNLFKLHASCFMNHAPLEALRALRAAMPFEAGDLEMLTVRVEPHYHKVVLTSPPRTGLEAKFNLPFCMALAVADCDTGVPATYSDGSARRRDLHALADRCLVEIAPDMHFESAEVEVVLRDGRRARIVHESGEPDTDLDGLAARIEAKTNKLVGPRTAAHLIAAFGDLAGLGRAAHVHPVSG